MNQIPTTQPRFTPASGFILISIILLCFNLLFVFINSRTAYREMLLDLNREGDNIHAAYTAAMNTSATDMQQLALTLAEQERIQQLFLQGKQAVEEEGGGAGGPRAEAIRNELLATLRGGQTQISSFYDFHQLHFYLAPNSTSFLRAHAPELFGDVIQGNRTAVDDANTLLIPTMGFETGPMFSGIRGVTPVFAMDQSSGQRVHVGVLEAGTSFAQLLTNLSLTFNADCAVFLQQDHLESIMWPRALGQMLAKHPPSNNLVLENTTDIDGAYMAVRHVQPGDRSQNILLTGNDPPLALNVYPIFDYHGQAYGGAPAGKLLVWRDITERLDAYKHTLKTNLLYGLAGFLLLESLVFVIFVLGNRRLREIVERKTGDLQQSEARYRAIFANNTAVMLLVDPDSGLVVESNDAAREFYGYTEEEFQQLYIWDINELPDGEVRQAMRKTIQYGNQVHIFPHRLKNGEQRQVHVDSGPLRFNGRVLLFSIIHDITTELDALRARQLAEEQYCVLFETAPVGIYRSTPAGRYLQVNDALARMYGYPHAAAMLGEELDIRDQLYAQPEEFDRLREQLRADGLVRDYEALIRRRDGEYIWTSRDAHVIRGNNGQIILYEGFVRDISTQKNFDEFREQVERTLRHNLKSPLIALINLPELLMENPHLDASEMDMLRLIQNSGRNMLNMIDNTLLLARVEQGTANLQFQLVNLLAVLELVSKELTEILETKDLDLEILVDGRPPDSPVLLNGEPSLIYSMLSNLMKNAAEASPMDATLQVLIDLKPRLVLTVANMGRVPREIEDRFFGKFVSHGKSYGTGLGAYSAKLVARAHKASISMRTDDVSGTRVTVSFPVEATDLTTDNAEADFPPKAEDNASSSK